MRASDEMKRPQRDEGDGELRWQNLHIGPPESLSSQLQTRGSSSYREIQGVHVLEDGVITAGLPALRLLAVLDELEKAGVYTIISLDILPCS